MMMKFAIFLILGTVSGMSLPLVTRGNSDDTYQYTVQWNILEDISEALATINQTCMWLPTRCPPVKPDWTDDPKSLLYHYFKSRHELLLQIAVASLTEKLPTVTVLKFQSTIRSPTHSEIATTFKLEISKEDTPVPYNTKDLESEIRKVLALADVAILKVEVRYEPSANAKPEFPVVQLPAIENISVDSYQYTVQWTILENMTQAMVVVNKSCARIPDSCPPIQANWTDDPASMLYYYFKTRHELLLVIAAVTLSKELPKATVVQFKAVSRNATHSEIAATLKLEMPKESETPHDAKEVESAIRKVLPIAAALLNVEVRYDQNPNTVFSHAIMQSRLINREETKGDGYRFTVQWTVLENITLAVQLINKTLPDPDRPPVQANWTDDPNSYLYQYYDVEYELLLSIAASQLTDPPAFPPVSLLQLKSTARNETHSEVSAKLQVEITSESKTPKDLENIIKAIMTEAGFVVLQLDVKYETGQ